MSVDAGAGRGVAFRQRDSRRLANEESHVAERLRCLAAHQPRPDAYRVVRRGRRTANGRSPTLLWLVPLKQGREPGRQSKFHGCSSVNQADYTRIKLAQCPSSALVVAPRKPRTASRYSGDRSSVLCHTPGTTTTSTCPGARALASFSERPRGMISSRSAITSSTGARTSCATPAESYLSRSSSPTGNQRK